MQRSVLFSLASLFYVQNWWAAISGHGVAPGWVPADHLQPKPPDPEECAEWLGVFKTAQAGELSEQEMSAPSRTELGLFVAPHGAEFLLASDPRACASPLPHQRPRACASSAVDCSSYTDDRPRQRN